MAKAKKDRIQPINLRKEMEDSYLAYSMAVIIGRAIPDLYDGLKPVQRRVLTAMKGLGLKSDGAFKKAARVDGETLGKYHPHGSVYGAMVTLAAPYRNNHRLIDGHGNWGSECDPPAAARYTECRLTSYSEDILLQDFSICDIKDNYDGSLKEPVRLESALPNVLIIGNEGIGVGYATNIPQHNLRDIAKASIGLLKGDSPAKLAKYLIPDFPSGCEIVKDEGLKEYIATGRGSIRQRAISTLGVYERDGRKANWDVITFTNLPYQTSTEKIGEEIKKLLDNGHISDIHHLSDESDRTGQRLLVFTKAGCGEKVRDELYRLTKLDTSFSANNTVVHNMSPKQYAPHEVIWHWLQWRDDRLVLKFQTELGSVENRLHIVEGLIKAISILDKVIAAIRKSSDKSEAKNKLMGRGFNFTDAQAEAILNMRLHALTGMDSKALSGEQKELEQKVSELKSLIEDKKLRDLFIIDQLEYIQKRHGNARVCQLITATAKVTPSSAPRKQVGSKVPKSRYVSVDYRKGIIDQLKGPRGSDLTLTDADKLIIISEDGWVKRLPARHNGPCFDEPKSISVCEKESKLTQTSYLAVWEFEGAIYSNCLEGELLKKTTSTGKRWMPEGAKLIHFGTKPYQLSFKSKRKKPKQLTNKNTKVRPVGSKGNKLAKIDEVTI